MEYAFPYTIENSVGEKVVFHTVEPSANGGDKVTFEGFYAPGAGPVMHTHFKQDESITVITGHMGYQFWKGAPQFAEPGQTVFLKRGIPHRFWAEGEEPLHTRGWVQPANTVVFFLSALYAAQNKSGKAQPETFDGAYLVTRYASEYDLPEVPAFVKKVIMPLTYLTGRLLGKYDHFKNAPPPSK